MMSESLRYNLFRFATRELSHSAFWAWVVQCSDPEAPRVPAAALACAFLDRVGAPRPSQRIDVETERTLSDGLGRVDIWIVIDDRDQVIIENKVTALPDAEQLARYRGALAQSSGGLHTVLLSTAFDAQFQLPDDQKDWIHLGEEELLDLFTHVPTGQQLVDHYRDWLTRLVEWRQQCRRNAVADNVEACVRALREPEGQWALLKCATQGMTGRLYRGTNRSGTPWTQFEFFAGAGDWDRLFYRIDNASFGPYLSVRQYQYDATPNLKAKMERLGRLRALWTESAERVGTTLTFRRPLNRGQKESEIAVLALNDNSVSRVVAELQGLHVAFVDALLRDGWPESLQPERGHIR